MASENIVTLSGTVDISKVENLLRDFKQAAELGSPVKIDASAVERIDTAGLQLLYSFQKTMSDQQGELSIDDPSEAFMDCARLVGFEKLLTLN